jgi:hypothetical protein
MKTAYGKRTSLWVGKLVEVYCDPSVRNPQGAKVGGVRLRIPAEDGGPEEYVSDLEEGYEEDEAAPPVPAKARH